MLLSDLIHSSVDDVIKMSKDALCNIQICLQDAHEKIEFLQLESQLQQDELHKRITILNLFLFRRLRMTPISNKKIKFQLIHIQFLALEQMYMQMQQLNLHFSSPSLDLGKSLSTTSTELVLDMTRMCPFIFRTTPSPSYFRVSDSCMTVHLQLFQILLHFHNNNRLRNANTVIELAI